MNDTQTTGTGLARPAGEEIKKHGDALQRQVDDAAGKDAHEKAPDDGDKAADDAA